MVTFNGGILASLGKSLFLFFKPCELVSRSIVSIRSPKPLIAGQPVDTHDAEESDEERGSVEAWHQNQGHDPECHGDTG